MLKISEMQRYASERAEHTRDSVNEILKDWPGRPATVGKHEARNWNHLKSVIEKADRECPEAADTIRWLLWWRSLDDQRVAQMSSDLTPDDAPASDRS